MGALTSTEKVIFFIPVAIVIGIIAVVFFYVASTYYQSIIFIPTGVEDEITFNRFFSSPGCFTYQDPFTNRPYPGIIDKEKFNQQHLSNCYNDPKSKNVELSIQRLDNNEQIKDSQGREIILRSENFRNKSPKRFLRNALLKDGELTYPIKILMVIESE